MENPNEKQLKRAKMAFKTAVSILTVQILFMLPPPFGAVLGVVIAVVIFVMLKHRRPATRTPTGPKTKPTPAPRRTAKKPAIYYWSGEREPH